MLLVTPGIFLLQQVEMSAVKMSILDLGNGSFSKKKSRKKVQPHFVTFIGGWICLVIMEMFELLSKELSLNFLLRDYR